MLNADAVAHNFWGAAAILLALLIAHALGDFALQGSFLSQAKNRNANLGNLFSEGAPSGLWWNALLAHCLIHAGAVWLVTGYVVLAAAELLLHGLIDYAKCEGWISFRLDQSLHRTCKVLYAVLLFAGWPPFLGWDPLV